MSATEAERESYRTALNWLWGAIHVVPAGVLWGSHGATPQECHEMLEGLEEFARLCERLGLEDHGQFIDQCRWHFERYPHYLGRRRHFASYEQYILARQGPVRVALPPRRW